MKRFHLSLSVAGILSSLYCFGPSQNVVLAGRTELPARRSIVLRAPERLNVVGTTNQLCLEILPPDSLNYPPYDYEWGIRRSDGALVLIGGAMIRPDGSADTLSSPGYSMGTEDCLELAPSVHDSLRPPFVGVRLTADDSIAVQRIVWRSWTSK